MPGIKKLKRDDFQSNLVALQGAAADAFREAITIPASTMM